jgi:hypothetical protein
VPEMVFTAYEGKETWAYLFVSGWTPGSPCPTKACLSELTGIQARRYRIAGGYLQEAYRSGTTPWSSWYNWCYLDSTDRTCVVSGLNVSVSPIGIQLNSLTFYWAR